MKAAKSNVMEMVFIVDDDLSIREGLCDLLDSVGMSARHFSTAEEFLAAWNPKLGGCLLLDVRLPGMSGMELQERLRVDNLSIPIIIMTAHGDVPMVRKALKSGAAEFLVKPFRDDELLHAILEIFADQKKRRKRIDLVNSIVSRMELLTAREREVMEFVSAGHTNEEIADSLHLSLVTIKMHRGQMIKKMEAESVADLVRMVDLAKQKGELNRS
jgi:FixJ family two-component response regulator